MGTAVCDRCREDLADGARFCARCGAAVEAAAEKTKPSASAPGNVGMACPYCRFPVKTGTLTAVCPACEAVHHTECWAENAGCAVVGCSGGPTGEPHQPAAQPDAASPPSIVGSSPPPLAPPPPRSRAPRRRSRSGMLAATAIGTVIVAIAALVVADGPATRVVTESRILRETVTNPSASEGTSRGNTASGMGASRSEPHLEKYTGSAITASIPAGWVQGEREVEKPQEIESTWHQPGDSGTYLLIDKHVPPDPPSLEAAAQPVRAQLEQESGYREISWEEGDLEGRSSWKWVFEVPGSERIDYFFDTCNGPAAVLGSSSPDRFQQLRTTFRAVASSVRTPCEE